jgi:hypothetical protein
MYRIALLSAMVALAAAWSLAQPPASPEASTESVSESAEDEQTTSVWMEKKLQHSQALLRGLAVADFADVRHNARRLKLLNRVEGFVRRRNPEYRAHLLNFSRVVAEIERQAVQENLEGATLAFNQLTVSCMECHKSLRAETAPDPAEASAR